MSSNFNPYHKWLGIEPEEQPVNHYRLLGIRLFESDAEVIDNAADRQMNHVRRYQHGPQVQWSQQLLNEIAAARHCLLNAADKRLYDQWLRERSEVAARLPAMTAGWPVPQYGTSSIPWSPPTAVVYQAIASAPRAPHFPPQAIVASQGTGGSCSLPRYGVAGGPEFLPAGKVHRRPMLSGRAYQRDEMRYLLTMAAAVLLFLSLGAWGTWELTNGVLVVDWPEWERHGGRLYLDGQPLHLPVRGTLLYRCRPGLHELRSARDGRENFVQRLDVFAGRYHRIHVRWSSSPARVPGRRIATHS